MRREYLFVDALRSVGYSYSVALVLSSRKSRRAFESGADLNGKTHAAAEPFRGREWQDRTGGAWSPKPRFDACAGGAEAFMAL